MTPPRIRIDSAVMREHAATLSDRGQQVIDHSDNLRAEAASINPGGSGSDGEVINRQYHESADRLTETSRKLGEMLQDLGHLTEKLADFNDHAEQARKLANDDYPVNYDPKLWTTGAGVGMISTAKVTTETTQVGTTSPHPRAHGH